MKKSTAAAHFPAVVITGASTGIGHACAMELDRLGFFVFAGVRTEAAGRQLQVEASPRLTPITLDVTDPYTIASAVQTVAAAVDGVGIAGLVNNAGIAAPGPLELLPIDALRRQLDVNVIGLVAVTQAFLPLLRKARGRVVNMSSINGGLAIPYMGAYSASKFAVEAITDALRLELRQWRIRVSAVEPGAITTPIWEKTLSSADEIAAGVDPETLSLYDADLKAIRREVDRSIQHASPVDRVVRAVVHALTSKRPRTRYFLGLEVRMCFKIMKMLPDPVRDWIVCKACGLS